MTVTLMTRVRALDGSEILLTREIEVPALPSAGVVLGVDGQHLEVRKVHLEVLDDGHGEYRVSLHGLDKVPFRKVPRNRAELARFCATNHRHWTVVPDGSHLRLVD